MSLIATNTISQGDTRKTSLEHILMEGGELIHAIRSKKWPGIANIEVAIVSISKGRSSNIHKILDGDKVEKISSYLDSSNDNHPFKLAYNQNKSFIGSIILGDGFILTLHEKDKLIKQDPKNKSIIFPYLTGLDLNSTVDQKSSRYVINFFDFDLSEAEKYQAPFLIIKDKVKPQRDKVKRKVYRERWWQYAERCEGLYKAISNLEKVLTIAQVSKTVAFAFVPTNQIFSAKLVVFNTDKYGDFAVLQSNMHFHWAWKYCTTMKNDLSYGPQNIFQTFPLIQNFCVSVSNLEIIGKKYYDYRQTLLCDYQVGLTQIYNLFHDPLCNIESIDKIANIRELKNAVLNISLEEALIRVEKLRSLHKEMDEAVLQAYIETYPPAGGKVPDLAHGFYEMEYLPESDRVRYTISPEARKWVLNYLLEINHRIHDEEVKAGLWDKKTKPAKEKKTNSKNEGEENPGFFG